VPARRRNETPAHNNAPNRQTLVIARRETARHSRQIRSDGCAVPRWGCAQAFAQDVGAPMMFYNALPCATASADFRN
jgi:hypothetical protein